MEYQKSFIRNRNPMFNQNNCWMSFDVKGLKVFGRNSCEGWMDNVGREYIQDFEGGGVGAEASRLYIY